MHFVVHCFSCTVQLCVCTQTWLPASATPIVRSLAVARLSTTRAESWPVRAPVPSRWGGLSCHFFLAPWVGICGASLVLKLPHAVKQFRSRFSIWTTGFFQFFACGPKSWIQDEVPADVKPSLTIISRYRPFLAQNFAKFSKFQIFSSISQKWSVFRVGRKSKHRKSTLCRYRCKKPGERNFFQFFKNCHFLVNNVTQWSS